MSATPPSTRPTCSSPHAAHGVRRPDRLDDIDFTVPRGSIVSLIGPNGAGKTTFFNMLTGVYTPTAGEIVFDGEESAG